MNTLNNTQPERQVGEHKTEIGCKDPQRSADNFKAVMRIARIIYCTFKISVALYGRLSTLVCSVVGAQYNPSNPDAPLRLGNLVNDSVLDTPSSTAVWVPSDYQNARQPNFKGPVFYAD